jgi:hypothetical protein
VLAETIFRLVDRAISHPDRGLEPEGLSLESYSYQKWLNDGRKRASAVWADRGWTAIPDKENEELWVTFSTRFSFNRSVSMSAGPAIIEPIPYATWSVSSVQKLYATARQQFRATERQSRQQLLQILVRLEKLVGQMYALDLNHAGFSLTPNMVSLHGVENWPVPLIPVHNYSLFVAPSFSFGVFCNPWEASICIFGTPLTERVLQEPLGCFGMLIRSSV